MIGEIRKSKELGYKTNSKFVYHACVDCGKERWVEVVYGEPKNPRCHSCANRKKQLKYEKIRDGYVYIYQPTHPKAVYYGYVKRAILVLEAKLGRYLREGYDSHHENTIRDDDRPENLEEIEHGEHMRITNLGKRRRIENVSR